MLSDYFVYMYMYIVYIQTLPCTMYLMRCFMICFTVLETQLYWGQIVDPLVSALSKFYCHVLTVLFFVHTETTLG